MISIIDYVRHLQTYYLNGLDEHVYEEYCASGNIKLNNLSDI